MFITNKLIFFKVNYKTKDEVLEKFMNFKFVGDYEIIENETEFIIKRKSNEKDKFEGLKENKIFDEFNQIQISYLT